MNIPSLIYILCHNGFPLEAYKLFISNSKFYHDKELGCALSRAKNQHPFFSQIISHFIVNGNDARVQFWISCGANIHYEDTLGYTPLINALAKNNKNIIQMLLNNGSDVNQKNKYGYTALYYAVTFLHLRDVKLLKLLVSYGANVNTVSILKQTPLLDAVSIGYTAGVRFLIENGAEINHVDNFQRTPLFYALSANTVKYDIVVMLVENGARLDHRDGLGRTVLEYARLHKIPEKSFDYLLQRAIEKK